MARNPTQQDRLRTLTDICLALPEARREDKASHAAFLVGKKTFAYYNPDGSWKATEFKMHWSWNLPEKVRHALRTGDFAAWYIMDIKRVEMPGQTWYAIHVNNSPLLDSDHAQIDHDEMEIFYNENGDLVRRDQK